MDTSSSSNIITTTSSSSSGSSSIMATKAATQRLMSDYKEMMTEPPEGCSAAPASESNLFVWNASIVGPEETPWEGFVVDYLFIFCIFSFNYH